MYRGFVLAAVALGLSPGLAILHGGYTEFNIHSVTFKKKKNPLSVDL